MASAGEDRSRTWVVDDSGGGVLLRRDSGSEQIRKFLLGADRSEVGVEDLDRLQIGLGLAICNLNDQVAQFWQLASETQKRTRAPSHKTGFDEHFKFGEKGGLRLEAEISNSVLLVVSRAVTIEDCLSRLTIRLRRVSDGRVWSSIHDAKPGQTPHAYAASVRSALRGLYAGQTSALMRLSTLRNSAVHERYYYPVLSEMAGNQMVAVTPYSSLCDPEAVGKERTYVGTILDDVTFLRQDYLPWWREESRAQVERFSA